MIPQCDSSNQPLEITVKNAQILGAAFWNIVNLYNLKRVEQAILLGVNPQNRKTLKDYEDARKIPKEADAFFRVSLLLGIHKNLRILYPQNKQVVYNWMTTKQDLFYGKSPIEFITKHPANSLLNMATVRRALDIIRTTH